MPPKQKKKLLWALQRTQLLLGRNACPHETFHRVLNRADVHALRTLSEFAKKELARAETTFI